MSNTQITDTAETIAALFDNDGMCFETPDGLCLGDVCADRADRIERDGSSERYTFVDGSSIVFAEAAWDVGFNDTPDCFCWAGVAADYPETDGHNPTCTHAEASQ